MAQSYNTHSVICACFNNGCNLLSKSLHGILLVLLEVNKDNETIYYS